MASKRGALIVVEGCDRAGKTTQCKRLGKAVSFTTLNLNFYRNITKCNTLSLFFVKLINVMIKSICQLSLIGLVCI